jgi:hypothetical protein
MTVLYLSNAINFPKGSLINFSPLSFLAKEGSVLYLCVCVCVFVCLSFLSARLCLSVLDNLSIV